MCSKLTTWENSLWYLVHVSGETHFQFTVEVIRWNRAASWSFKDRFFCLFGDLASRIIVLVSLSQHVHTGWKTEALGMFDIFVVSITMQVPREVNLSKKANDNHSHPMMQHVRVCRGAHRQAHAFPNPHIRVFVYLTCTHKGIWAGPNFSLHFVVPNWDNVVT